MTSIMKYGVVVELTPEEEAEFEAWRRPSPTVAREAKLAEINAQRAAALEAGVPYTFGGVDDAIQTRQQDQVNLLTIWTAAREAQEAGITDPVIEFRAMSDTNYMLTPAEALAMTAAVRAHGYAAYQASWARKTALDEIDLNAPDALEQIAAI
jgi:hypothetical protein